MKRDIIHYFEAELTQVYYAFRQAAKTKFNKNAEVKPFHTMTVPLDYSMRYNMTGGALTIHFIPCNSGTAVNMHFTVVQAAGARCNAYDDDMIGEVEAILGVKAQKTEIPVETFENPAYQISAAGTAPAVQPAAQPQPAPQTYAQPQPAAQPLEAKPRPAFCSACGNKLSPTGNFCTACGKKIG